MNIEAEYSTSEMPVDWGWPVQIAYLNELVGADGLNRLSTHHWLKSLAHVFRLSRIRHKSNVLFLNGTLEEIEKCLRSHSFLIKADLVVLLMEPATTSIPDGEQALKEIQNISFNSCFIAQLPGDRSPVFWLDELIHQLSHNNNIGEAIDNIGLPGKLVVSEELLIKSNVSNVMEDMLDDIVKGTVYTNYNFDEVLTKELRQQIDSNSEFTARSVGDSPAEVIADVKMQKESFKYHNESDESTIIKDIAVRHSKNVSDMVGRFGAAVNEAKDDVNEAVSTSTARYLQCVFHDQEKKPAHHALLTNLPYTLTVKIDNPDEEFMQGGVVTADDVEVKRGSAERVDILLRYRDELNQQHIMLPFTGASSEATFEVEVAEEGETIFELFAFHKNRLFQQIGLSVFYCKQEAELGNVPSMKMEMINMPRTTLNDFELKEKYGLSIVFTDGYPIMAKETSIQEIRNEEQLNTFNEELTAVIEGYVKFDDPDGDELILALAEKGAVLYKNLFAGNENFNEPIQIISPSSKHFPLEFVYTHKLHRKAEKLCPKASDALASGTCAGCNEGDEKYICPFGFAALRTVIERHHVGENVDKISPNAVGLKTDVSMTRPAIPILAKTLFGTSERVDKSEPGLRKRFGQKVTVCSGSAKEATDWDIWSEAIEADKPDSLIIIGHVESPKNGRSKQLEIGDDLLRKASIDEEFVLGMDADATPFMILIGCNTQDVEMSFLDFATHFKKCGAAIVLSTFTKIRGSHAVPLVEQLLEMLHSRKGADEIRFGEVMLELRRKLFAQGLYVSMAMVAHGDADWKLKI